MITYQDEKFIELLEIFKKEYKSEAQKKEIKDNEWRKSFIAEYPRDSIRSMSMNSFLISRKSFGNPNSFCRRICSQLKDTFHIKIDNNWSDTFGIALKNGTQLTLSKAFAHKFGSDYDKAFTYIKNEITNLLDEVDRNNYTAVKHCEFSNNFKYMLLIIYCPEKILPVCTESLLHRYCERTCIAYDSHKEMIDICNILIKWKNDVPEIADWSNSIFTSFCDWLYRKSESIDGNSLTKEAHIAKITEEIEALNLHGKSKEAVVKVRVNQGIFRDKLLQRYSKCCLCGVSNPNLLIASHIKPWCESEPNEKLDMDNGFLMCPNHDRLFDQGWLTFDDNGNIIIADRLSEGDRISLNVKDNMKVSLTEKNKKYLHYHRKKFKETNCFR